MTLRSRIVALVVAVAVLPLGLLGAWLAGSAARSGEELLRARLEGALRQAAAAWSGTWAGWRSTLLDLSASEAVRTAVTGGEPAGAALDLAGPDLPLAGPVRFSSASVRADASPESGGVNPAAGLPLVVDVHSSPLGPRVGALQATFSADDLARVAGTVPAAAGMVLAAYDARDGTFLTSAPFDPALLRQPRFRWGGEEWLTATRTLSSPPLVLVAAAPLTPYTGPFRETAARALLIVFAVALAGLAAAVVLTRRMTHSLEGMAAAADAVAAGNLEHRVAEHGGDELARVARAFNHMTRSLRRTLRELADQRSLAAVGEFAASLAHEIRNPLTSIRVDLQMVEESLPHDSKPRQIQAEVLREVERLDATVRGALYAARSGREGGPMDLRAALRAALRLAGREAETAGVRLEVRDAEDAPLPVRGDEGALQRLFLNLLLNAVQASRRGGTVEVRAARSVSPTRAVVEIRDHGSGMEEEVLERAMDPLFSTRSGGTGLGLPMARRIAEAHGGALELESAPGVGTNVRVVLPLDQPAQA